MGMTADRLEQSHIGKHITLIDPAGSVSGRLLWFLYDENDPEDFHPVLINIEIFGGEYELKVSPHTEVEVRL